jgi:hypothetical protein
VERGFLLDVIVAQSPSVLELFAGEDEALLIRGDTIASSQRSNGVCAQRETLPLLVLYFRLDIVDGVGRLDLESDGLAREGLDEYLHC